MLEELEQLREVVGEEHGEALASLESAVRAHVAASEEQAGLMTAAMARAEAAEADVRERDGRLEAAATEIARVRGDLVATLEAYRSAVRAQIPGAPELIQGDTVESINASLEAAKGMVARIESAVRDQVEDSTRRAAAGVPAGMPERAGADVEAMSPAEKIRHGLRVAR